MRILTDKDIKVFVICIHPIPPTAKFSTILKNLSALPLFSNTIDTTNITTTNNWLHKSFNYMLLVREEFCDTMVQEIELECQKMFDVWESLLSTWMGKQLSNLLLQFTNRLQNIVSFLSIHF